MKMVYKWRDGARFTKLSAPKVGSHLETLRKKSGGNLNARLVVRDARDKASPLHRAFEWNDGRAAEQFRLQQACQLIASVVIVTEDKAGHEDGLSTRAFVVVNKGKDDAFTSIKVAMESPLLRAKLLAQALSELESWKKRYADLEELADIFKASERLSA